MKEFIRRLIGAKLTQREERIISVATGIADGEGWWSWDEDKDGDPPEEREIFALQEKLGAR